MLRLVTTKGVQRERLFTLCQVKSTLGDQEVLVVIDVTNRAVTGVCVQNFGCFYRPLNATAMAAPGVRDTLRCLCRLRLLSSYSDLLDEPRGIPTAAPIGLDIGVMVINHCRNWEMKTQLLGHIESKT